MGKTLQELGLKEEVLPTAGEDLDDLPVFGSWAPPPPPGPYRFKLPMDLSAVWEPFLAPDKTPPERVRMLFDRDHPLQIVQCPKGVDLVGEPFETRLSNNERKRGKKGSDSKAASDLDYLLRALGERVKPRSNTEYIRMVQRHAGKEFAADITYNWQCSDQRDGRWADPTGTVHLMEGRKGCGEKFYEKDVPKQADGKVPLEVDCSSCGARLRAFANVDNIRS